MLIPPTITFRQLRRIPALEADILARLARLERYCPWLIGARVLVEPAGRHHRTGSRFHVRIDLKVPDEEIAISHEASVRPTARAIAATRWHKEDEPAVANRWLGVAIREAFGVARRRLQDYVRARRRDVKTHALRPMGRVVRLVPSRSYGILETSDGREVYFHRRSVLNEGFGRLRVGSRVAFAEEEGRDGPQASTVRRLR